MKSYLKRLTALILVLAMCLSLISANVWAAELIPQETTTSTEEDQEPQEEIFDDVSVPDSEMEPDPESESEEDQLSSEDTGDQPAFEEEEPGDESEEPIEPEQPEKESEEPDEQEPLREVEDSVKQEPVESSESESEDETGEELSPQGIISFGYCGAQGDNLTWTLDDSGTLTISGIGDMTDYSIGSNSAPWYRNYSAIKTVVINTGVTSIGKHAFYYCSSIVNIIISDTVSNIGPQALYDCFSLKNISVAEDNNYFKTKDDVLFDKSGETLIQFPAKKQGPYSIPDTVTTIGDYAFFPCDTLTTMTIPDSVTSIGEYAFRSCRNLKSVIIPNSITCISRGAFADCYALNKVNIPNSVTSIGDCAFDYCALPNVIIPDSVTSIGDYAFRLCSQMTSITIPASVSSIGYCALERCPSLAHITVAEGNAYYEAIDDVLYDKKHETLIRYPEQKQGSYSIPSGVINIEAYAFMDCINLISVDIPDSVARIGRGAFQNCNSLTDMNIPDGVDSIYLYTFFGCQKIASVCIPVSIMCIEESAFRECYGLRDVYYAGSNTDWKKINIDYDYNSCMTREATFHYNSTGPNGSSGTAAEAYKKLTEGLNSNQYAIFVQDSTGNAIDGALVTWNWNGNQEGTTDQNGMVSFERESGEWGNPFVTVSKDGYRDYSTEGTDFSLSADQYSVVVLYTLEQSQYCLKQATYLDETGAIIEYVDLLTHTKEVSSQKYCSLLVDGQYNETAGMFALHCCAISTDNLKSYNLMQGDEIIASSPDGHFAGLDATRFTPDEMVFVRVNTDSGERIDTPVNLKIVKENAVENMSLKWSPEGVSFEVSDDIPIFGGSKMDYEFPTTYFELYISEDNTIHVGVNTQIFSKGIADGKTGVYGPSAANKKKWDDLQDTCNQLRKLSGLEVNKSLQDKIDGIINPDGKEGSIPGAGKVSMNFLGYAEGKMNEKGQAKIKGYICLTISYNKTFQGPTTVVVCVPVTYSFKIGASGKISAEISYDVATRVWNGEVGLSITPSIYVFGGIGVGSVVGAGAYGSLTMPITFRIISSSQPTGLASVDLEGEMGLKAYAGPFTWEKAFVKNTWHLYTKDALTDSQGSGLGNSLYQQSLYVQEDTTYLEQESEWLGAQNDSRDTTAVLKVLQTNTYHNMKPLLGDANGLPVMVWVRGNTQRGTMDVPQLVYSVCEDGNWSEPQPVDPDNTTCDESPSLSNGGDGTLYLTYQNSSSHLGDESTLSDYVAVQSIVTARFDADAKKFTDFTTLSSSGSYNHMPSIATGSGKQTAVWVKNDDTSDYFGQNQTNALLCSTYENNTWSEPLAIASDLNAVRDISVGELGGIVSVAVVIDDDNDLSTESDGTLMLYSSQGGQGQAVDHGKIGKIMFTKIPGNDAASLVWNNGSSLCSYQNGTTTMILEQYGIQDYRILSDRIVFNTGSGSGSNLFACVYDGDWNAAVQIVDQNSYIQNYDVKEINGESFLVASQTSATVGSFSVDTQSTLSWGKITAVTDLSIKNVYADESTANKGEEYTVSVDVVNNSDHKVNGFTLTAYDSAHTALVSQDFAQPLKAGETSSVSIVMPALAAKNYNYTCTVELTADGDQKGNNSDSFTVGKTDLSVTGKVVRIGSRQMIYATVRNNSIIPSMGTLELYSDDAQLGTINFKELSKNGSTLIAVDVTPNLMKEMTSSIVTLKVQAEKEDGKEYNNTHSVLLSLYGTASEGLSWKYNGVSDTLTVTGNGELRTIEADNLPWKVVQNTVENLVLEGGVTGIGQDAFANHSKLSSATIPASVSSIGDNAFLGCANDLTIYGYDGSAAQQYAAENNIPFIDIENPYRIIVNDSQGGTITANKTGAKENDSIVLTFIPDDGYELKGITYTPENGETQDVTMNESMEYSFIMPGANVNIEAVWQALPTLSAYTTDGTASVGTISAPNGPFHSGDSITITAPRIKGYIFLGWYPVTTVEDEQVTGFDDTELLGPMLSYTFTIDSDTSIVAVYQTGNGIDVPTAKELTYTGAEQALVNPGHTEFGALLYSTSENGTYSTSIPTKKDAGTYTVWYKDGEGGVPESVEVTISEKMVGLDWSDTIFVYDGEEHAPAATATGLIDGDTCTVTIDGAEINASTTSYTATASGLSNSNYKLPDEVTQDFNISPKGVTVTPNEKSTAYGEDIAELTFTVEGLVKESDMGSLKVKLSTTASKTAPAGSYVITGTQEEGFNTNYSVTIVDGKKYTINQADATITARAYSGVYDGQEHGISVSVTDSRSDGNIFSLIGKLFGKEPDQKAEATVYYSTVSVEDAREKKNTIAPTRKDVGTTTVYYSVEFGGNYGADPVTGTQTVTITAQEVGLTWSNTSFTFDGKLHVPTATATGLVGSDVCTVTVDGAQTNAGTYTATATALSNENYKLPDAVTQTFTIKEESTPAPTDPTPTDPTPTDPTPTDSTPTDPTYNNLTASQKNLADSTAASLEVDAETAAQMVQIAAQMGVSADVMQLGTKKLASMNVDNKDPKGSTFHELNARASKRGKDSLTLQWKKHKKADGFLVYGNKCGKKNKLQLLKTFGKKSTKWTQKKLKKGTYYKYLIVAYKNVNGKKMPISAAVTVYSSTKGGKKTVAKGLTLTQGKKVVTKLTLKKKASATIKASEVPEEKMKISSHRKVKFESDNTKVATVDAKGKITAKKKGTATIYAYAQNGVFKTVKVTVK